MSAGVTVAASFRWLDPKKGFTTWPLCRGGATSTRDQEGLVWTWVGVGIGGGSCPSRSSIFSGRYAHNHGVRTNADAKRLLQYSTVQRYLRNAGYRTAIAGRYRPSWPLGGDPPRFRSLGDLPHSDSSERRMSPNSGPSLARIRSARITGTEGTKPLRHRFLNRVSEVRVLPGALSKCRVPGDAVRSGVT